MKLASSTMGAAAAVIAAQDSDLVTVMSRSRSPSDINYEHMKELMAKSDEIAKHHAAVKAERDRPVIEAAAARRARRNAKRARQC
jgi:hypothetical protein